MLNGRFAQIMEALSIACIVLGIIALCQNMAMVIFTHGFKLLVAGWLGLTIWSHRRPVRAEVEFGNPQVTVDGHAPLDVSISGGH